MKKKQVTLLELGKRLNLSPSTVSRALNDRHRISEATRKRVKALAEELEYRPNPSAKNLRESKTYTLGVLLPRVSSHFFAEVINGIEEITISAGYNIIICQSHESVEREQKVAETLLINRVDGLLLCPSQETTDFKLFRSFIRKDIPIVFFDRFGKDFEASHVVVDDYDGAFKGVEHLIESGKKRIAHLAGPDNLTISKERKRGYLDALKKHQLPIDESLIRVCDLHTETQIKQIQALLELEQIPDSIFCFNDPTAFRAMKIVKKAGYQIPKDISILGFGNQAHAELMDPTLSTVDQHARKLGQIATQLMLDQLKLEGTDDMPEYKTVTVKTNLIIRESSSI